MTKDERVFYSVQSFGWVEPTKHTDGYWREMGSGPGGITLEEAHKRVIEAAKRIDISRIKDVKFKITKIITISENVAEFDDADLTALILTNSK